MGNLRQLFAFSSEFSSWAEQFLVSNAGDSQYHPTPHFVHMVFTLEQEAAKKPWGYKIQKM
jgi:hypothetical protein